jgi:hypothetical protein
MRELGFIRSKKQINWKVSVVIEQGKTIGAKIG